MSSKTKSRQIAVQGIYNILLLGKTPENMEVFLNELITSASAKQPVTLDRDYCRNLLEGILFRQGDLETLLKKHSTSKLHSPLVKAILLAGAFELLVMTELSAKTIVSEYVTQAELYFDVPERPFIHAVLDAISKDVRS